MIQAQSADGKLHEFPDGTPDAVVDRAMRDYAASNPVAAPKPSAKATKPAPKPAGALAGYGQARARADQLEGRYDSQSALINSLGVGDELAGAMQFLGQGAENLGRRAIGRPVAVPASTAYRAGVDAQKSAAAKYADEHPFRNAATALGGMAAFGPAKGALSAVKAIGSAAGVGGVLGAASAEEGDRLAGGARGAAIGGGLGVLGQGAAAALSRRAAPKAANAAATLDKLKADKNAAYKAVDNSGVAYKDTAFGKMVSDIDAAATADRMNPIRHEKAASMVADLKTMAKRKTAPTLTELDQLRQVVRRDVANATDDAEQHFGRLIINKIDEFVDSAGPKDVSAGTAADGAGLIKKARDLNTRARKVEGVNDAIESAKLRTGSTGSGGNLDNATRQNLRRVLETTPNLTAEETAALESIVLGDKSQNAMRLVGKLSPTGNGLMTALSLGGAMTNPVLGAPAFVGTAAKVAADGITQRKVARLVELMAAGGTKAQVQQAAAQVAPLAAKYPVLVKLLQRAGVASPLAVGALERANAKTATAREDTNRIAPALQE